MPRKRWTQVGRGGCLGCVIAALVLSCQSVSVGGILDASVTAALTAERDVFGYTSTDPAQYDSSLGAEKKFDAQRSVKECFCGQSRHRSVWLNFYVELQRQLSADPSFSGEWVHRLCGSSYPVIFRVIQVDPTDDSFMLNSDCPAGLLSMVLVCAQSSALQSVQAGSASLAGAPAAFRAFKANHGAAPDKTGPDVSTVLERESGRWGSTARVVLEEGPSVGDFFGPVPLDECILHCERVARCQSIAFGPHGCHLKARCVGADDPVVPEGVQGADYRTIFREGCQREEDDSKGGLQSPPSMRNSHLQEMQNMMGFALRALEFCLHCLDSSPWPFLLGEVLENYALAVEAPQDFFWRRASGRLLGPSTQPGTRSKVDFDPPHLDPPAPEALATLGALPAIRLTLLRLQVRWTRGLEMEAEFWRGKLSMDPEENTSLERLKKWLATGEVPWTLPGDDLCAFLADARRRSPLGEDGTALRRSVPRILNAGSGPLAPRPLECELEPAWLPAQPESASKQKVWPVPVIAADGLARYYNKILDERAMAPPYLPLQCPVEELHSCFPPGNFDVVHIRNALDHVFDPLLGIERMLHVVRPGGWVLLRHARNEGVPGQFRNGLHQWAFDVIEPADGGKARFLIWNPDLRVDVTSHLLGHGLAAEVKTVLEDHPSDDAPEDERYVWVDIRKPTANEAAEHRRKLAKEADAEDMAVP